MTRINVDAKACRENQIRANAGRTDFVPCVVVSRIGSQAIMSGVKIHGPSRVVARLERGSFTIRIETDSEVTEE